MSWFWKKKEVPPKPADLVEYRIGFACQEQHPHWVQNQGEPVFFYKEKELICPMCGEKSYPSVLRVTFDMSGMFSRIKDAEFVRFLDKEDSIWLDERAVSTLRKYAARSYQESDSDPDVAYQKGLHDGTIETAKFVLGELKEKTANA